MIEEECKCSTYFVAVSIITRLLAFKARCFESAGIYMDEFAVDGLRYLRLWPLSRALRSHVTMHTSHPFTACVLHGYPERKSLFVSVCWLIVHFGPVMNSTQWLWQSVLLQFQYYRYGSQV